jgi:hypothetical protein
MIAYLWLITFSIALAFSIYNAWGAYQEREEARRIPGIEPVYLITGNSILQSEVVRGIAFLIYAAVGALASLDPEGNFAAGALRQLIGPALLTGGVAMMSNTILSFVTRMRVRHAPFPKKKAVGRG